MKMTKDILIILLLFLFSCPGKSAQIEKGRNSYIKTLKRELVDFNKQMPYEDMKGNWLWSINLQNDTIVVIRKIDSSFVIITNRKVDMMNNMADVYLKNMANRLEYNDINQLQKYGIPIQIQLFVKETDSLLYKQIMTAEDLYKAKMSLLLENNKGFSPLSYYNALFEQLNGALPRAIDNETTLIKIKMYNNNLYIDYAINDAYAKSFEEALKNKSNRDMMKKELQSYFRNYMNQWSADMRSDFKTYNIVVHFYYCTTKGILIDVISIKASELF